MGGTGGARNEGGTFSRGASLPKQGGRCGIAAPAAGHALRNGNATSLVRRLAWIDVEHGFWQVIVPVADRLNWTFRPFATVQAKSTDPDSAPTKTLMAIWVCHRFRIRYLHGMSVNAEGMRDAPVVLAAPATVLALQAALTYVPPLQAPSHTTPFWPGHLVARARNGMVLVAILEIDKRAAAFWKRNPNEVNA